jgi:hypothetical protein
MPSRNEELVIEVHDLVRNDGRVTIHEIGEEMGIFYG